MVSFSCEVRITPVCFLTFPDALLVNIPYPSVLLLPSICQASAPRWASLISSVSGADTSVSSPLRCNLGPWLSLRLSLCLSLTTFSPGLSPHAPYSSSSDKTDLLLHPYPTETHSPWAIASMPFMPSMPSLAFPYLTSPIPPQTQHPTIPPRPLTVDPDITHHTNTHSKHHPFPAPGRLEVGAAHCKHQALTSRHPYIPAFTLPADRLAHSPQSLGLQPPGPSLLSLSYISTPSLPLPSTNSTSLHLYPLSSNTSCRLSFALPLLIR